VHQNAATFEFVRAFEHILPHKKFRDDISNGSKVIALTNKQTDKQTLLKNTTFAILSLRRL